jgi:hypothetical protein
MWASVQEGIASANDNPIGAGNAALDKALGPSFDYLQTIRSPAEKGVSSDGNFDQVYTNARAIGEYNSNLIRGPKVGNQFFQSTGGKCRAPDGSVVDYRDGVGLLTPTDALPIWFAPAPLVGDYELVIDGDERCTLSVHDGSDGPLTVVDEIELDWVPRSAPAKGN